MGAEVKVLFATPDNARRIINVAIEKQAVDLQSVEVYKAKLENICLLESRTCSLPNISDIPFPMPHSSARGYVAEFRLVGEDDYALLVGALNNYFGTVPFPSEKAQKLQKKVNESMRELEKKANGNAQNPMETDNGNDVKLQKPAKTYARVRLPYEGGCDIVDAFLGYKFEPTRESIRKLMNVYPGVLKLTKPKDSEFMICSVSTEPKRQPGIEVVKEKADAAQKDRRCETPTLEETNFFNNLLGIYDKKINSSVASIDSHLLGVFAGSEGLLPYVRKESIAPAIVKKGKTFEFETEDEILEEFNGTV